MKNYLMRVYDVNGACDEYVELMVTDVVTLIKKMRELNDGEITYITVMRQYKGYGKWSTVYEWERK